MRLIDDVSAIFLAAGYPKDAAVFQSLAIDPEGSVFFFNPGASRLCAALLTKLSATPCADPGNNVGLAVGHQDALYQQTRQASR